MIVLAVGNEVKWTQKCSYEFASGYDFFNNVQTIHYGCRCICEHELTDLVKFTTKYCGINHTIAHTHRSFVVKLGNVLSGDFLTMKL